MFKILPIKFNIPKGTNAPAADKTDSGAKNTIATNPIQSEKTSDTNANYKSIYTNTITTRLNSEDEKKYVYLTNLLKNEKISENAEGLSPNQQLDLLLKNGKLLQKSNNDKTTTLDNLYEIATKDRLPGLDKTTLITNILDIVVNPRIVTQRFGDIPEEEKSAILDSLPEDDTVRRNPNLMDVDASGTCAAASNEVNLADKYPADFARWVNHLSSPEKAVYLDIPLTAVSPNRLDALTILRLMEADIVDFSFDKVRIKASPDDNAYIRAKIQTNHWDKGERNVADVLVQSTVMQLGSQNTYNSLTDTRGGSFSKNSQGLIEAEKTFVETLIRRKEITSLIYQKIDDNDNLSGYNCSFDKTEKHIKDSVDTGNDVIMGYVLTNETSGKTSNSYDYDPMTDGAANKIISGHEITVVDYNTDENGKTVFTCIDTDDDDPGFVRYDADWLLPKIHHAGYPAVIVKDDEKEIIKNALS